MPFFFSKAVKKVSRRAMESSSSSVKMAIKLVEAVERKPWRKVVILSMRSWRELVFSGVVTLLIENCRTFNTILTWISRDSI